MNADTFIQEMKAWPTNALGGNYGQYILGLWDTLTDTEREECLREGRSKHVCTAIETKCMENEVPDEYTTDLKEAMKVIKSCPLTFPPVYVKTWMKLPKGDKMELLECARVGIPWPATNGKRKWLNLSGLIYTVMMEEY